MYKALPQTIAERESDLSTCAAELAEVKGTLTKPWDEYTAHWEGSRRVPLHIGARRAYDLTNRQEYIKNDITELKRFAAQSLRKHTENERKVKDAAATLLYNAAALAATRTGGKNPLREWLDRKSTDEIESLLAPLVEAESVWLQAAKDKKSKPKPPTELEGVVKTVGVRMSAGVAAVLPDAFYAAVKGATKSAKDYILLGRGILIPARALVDWLKIVADDPAPLTLKIDERVMVLKVDIGRTHTEFTGIDGADVSQFPTENGFYRCLRRVNFIPA